MSTDDPVSPDRLPAPLVERLDELDARDLRAVHAYVERRFEDVRAPIKDRIHTEAAGDVVEIEDEGPYTLVRQRPSDGEETTADSPLTFLYSVRWDPRPEGEDTLNWSYLGNVKESTPEECHNCGTPVGEHAQVCPQCGTELTDADSREEDHD